MCVFGVVHNYINVVVYGVFLFCLSKLIRNSPFAKNTASLSRLPINASYLSRFSINISGSDMFVAGIWIYNSKYLTNLPIKTTVSSSVHEGIIPCKPLIYSALSLKNGKSQN